MGCDSAHLNTTAIICDLQQFQAALFDEYLERGRARIHSILDELLQGMHRGDNDLSCGNFVHDIGVQSLKNRDVSITISKRQGLLHAESSGRKMLLGEVARDVP